MKGIAVAGWLVLPMLYIRPAKGDAGVPWGDCVKSHPPPRGVVFTMRPPNGPGGFTRRLGFTLRVMLALGFTLRVVVGVAFGVRLGFSRRLALGAREPLGDTAAAGVGVLLGGGAAGPVRTVVDA